MLRHAKSMIVLAAVVAIALAGCAPSAAPTKAPAAPDKVKVALLVPGVITDGSWCQDAYEGLKKAEADCGIEIAYTENVSQDEQVEVMRTYAAEGYNIIHGHGGEYVDAAETVAKEYPDMQFVVSNSYVAHDNVSAIRLSYGHQGYLAGVLAAKMSKTGKIGVLSAEPLTAMVKGMEQYRAGAESVNPNIEVMEVYTGDWEDVALAQEASLALIADGADVLLHILDAADKGMFNAGEDEGVWTIGTERDCSPLGPNYCIASTIGAVDMLVYESACGNVPWGEVATQDVSNYVYIEIRDQVPEDIKAFVLDVQDKMKSGELYVEP